MKVKMAVYFDENFKKGNHSLEGTTSESLKRFYSKLMVYVELHFFDFHVTAYAPGKFPLFQSRYSKTFFHFRNDARIPNFVAIVRCVLGSRIMSMIHSA